MVILFLGIIYVMSQRSGSGFVSFILIGIAAITMFYWVKVVKKMTKEQKPAFSVREQEAKIGCTISLKVMEILFL